MQNDFVIDAVFTWVDGCDEMHRQKMQPYLNGSKNWENKKFSTRFNQVDEIEFAIKSVLKFAPFIRSIFIVTDEQTPSFLKFKLKKEVRFLKVKIVDHKEIFSGYEQLLPVFNCRPIETLLYRIPNLAEHFIYFNDDFSLLRKVTSADFFKNGFPVLRGKWTAFDKDIWYKKLHNKIMLIFGKTTKDKTYGYRRGQQIAARKVGFNTKYFRLDHTPAPMRKSTLENFFKENVEMQMRNIRHKFRNPEQYVLQSLANHLEIKNKTAILKKDYQLIYIGSSHKKPLIWYRKKMSNSNKDKLFLCLQSLDLCSTEARNFLIKTMNKRVK